MNTPSFGKRRFKLSRLACSVLLVALAGCATHSDIQPRATLQNPTSFGDMPLAAQPGWQAKQAYWKQLGDPQLDALVDEALADSPTLAAADSRIRKAAALTDAAQSALFPEVSGNYKTTAQHYSERGMVPPPYAGTWRTDNRITLDAGIELDLWGKYRKALQGAEALRKVSELELAAARVALSANVTRAYLEFDRLYRQQSLIDKLIAMRQEAERLQAVRVKAGLDAEIDRNLQQLSIAQLRTERAQLDERIGLQRDLLAALAGKGPERGAQLQKPTINGDLDARLPSVLPADLLAGRPDLVASRWRVEAAARDIDVARTQFYPSVNLVAFIGFTSIGIDQLFDHEARTSGISPAVHLPIFEAGRLRAGLAMKTADYDAAVDQYNASLSDALRDVCDQARSLEAAQKQGELVADGMVVAQRGVKLVERRMSQGMANRINLVSAQMQTVLQERAAVDMRAHRLDAALGLVRALGGGFAPEQNPFTLAEASHS